VFHRDPRGLDGDLGPSTLYHASPLTPRPMPQRAAAQPSMNTFKVFWSLHKWTGLACTVLIFLTCGTGLMLLLKKQVAWIQPPTRTGAPGEVSQFLPLSEAFEIALRMDHPDFATVDDIDRVDVRPDARVYKLRSKHHHSEVQLCAVTGEVLSIATRRSDLIEELHDGSYFGAWLHDWGMVAYAVALAFLAFSGWWIWLAPKLRKRRRSLD